MPALPVFFFAPHVRPQRCLANTQAHHGGFMLNTARKVGARTLGALGPGRLELHGELPQVVGATIKPTRKFLAAAHV